MERRAKLFPALVAVAIAGRGAFAERTQVSYLNHLLQPEQESAPAPAADPRGLFSESCQLYPEKRVVLVTVNMDFLDMFKNWLHFAKPHLKSTEQLRVIAEDEEVVAPLEKLQAAEAKAETPLNFAVVAPQQGSSLLQAPWDSKAYGKVVWQRPQRILDVLNSGCSVLYSDIDTVWVKDPFLDIEAAGASNLVLTHDDNDPKGTNFCTCLMYMHPAPETKDLMTKWGASMHGHQNQPPFNAELRKVPASSALKMAVLPFDKFPPGQWADDHPDATIFHANWVIGLGNKVKFLRDRQKWVV